jgi:hypothetical protein
MSHKKRNSLDNHQLKQSNPINFQITPQTYNTGQTSTKIRQVSYSPYHGQTKFQSAQMHTGKNQTAGGNR